MRAHFASSVSAIAALPLVLSVGCSDPPPATPEGGFELTFSDPGAACAIASHEAFMGDWEAAEPVLLADGADGAEVTCTVEPVGGGFKVSARLAGTGPLLSISIDSISTDASSSSPVEGRASYASTQTGGDTFTPTATLCAFWFEGSQTVQAGEIWASFSCPALSSEGNECAISTGQFRVINCSAGATEEE